MNSLTELIVHMCICVCIVYVYRIFCLKYFYIFIRWKPPLLYTNSLYLLWVTGTHNDVYWSNVRNSHPLKEMQLYMGFLTYYITKMADKKISASVPSKKINVSMIKNSSGRALGVLLRIPYLIRAPKVKFSLSCQFFTDLLSLCLESIKTAYLGHIFSCQCHSMASAPR